MTPRLVLLTGPAAGEVYRVLLQGCPLYPPGHPVNEKDGHWWDEVRDYFEAPFCIADRTALGLNISTLDPSGKRDTIACEAAIRSLPSGEAWLVGLVLPKWNTPGPGWVSPVWQWPELREQCNLPARLAILAPEPPPLLVERVRAWGGEVWECYVSQTGNHVILTERFHGADPGSGCLASGDTWPETVRAALGEVAPC